MEAAAGLVPNRATIADIYAALHRAPNLLERLGLSGWSVKDLDRASVGVGHYAHVFALPNGMVLKVTDDEDDARVCEMISRFGEGYPGLPFIEAVYRLPGDVYENETEPSFDRPLFAIVMEAVTPASKTRLSWTRDGERRPRLLGKIARFPEGPEVALATDEALGFAKTIRRGLAWLERHGVSVVDLHHGNVGYASGKRPVIIDFGHGSLQDDFMMKPIKVASNPAKKPTERQVLTVWRDLGAPTVDMDELRMGIEVEQEHGVGMREAGKIAMDHLREFPDYYTRLVKMEERAKKGLPPNPIQSNRGNLSRARRLFDECFDIIEERFPDFGECELHEDEAAGSDNGAGSERQFGYCKDGNPIVIAFAAKVEGLPEANIRGLMRHEFGHALDYRYGRRPLERQLGVKLSPMTERRADQIAEAVFGEPIEYDQKLIQCIDCGGVSPRPRRLPK
jgi:hypothetical protein